MSQDRNLIGQRILQRIESSTAVDIYAVAEALKREFPEVPESELEQIVSEEVVLRHGNAVWHRRCG